MIKLVIILILLIFIFLLVGLLFKNHERFAVVFKPVDIYSDNAYDSKRLGPKCLAQCILNHGPNIRFNNCEGYSIENLNGWNKKNPTKGYCYRANDTKFPFLCNGTTSDKTGCKDKCGMRPVSDKDYGDNPDIDFSQCVRTEDMGCIEKGGDGKPGPNGLNFLSGGGCEITNGCHECISKYWEGIEQLKGEVDALIKDEKCRQNNDKHDKWADKSTPE